MSQNHSLMVKKFHPDAIIPTYAHNNDAGCDFTTPESITVPARGRMMIPTGIGMAIPDGYMLRISDKSGLASKGLHTMGGIVDAGYRGEINVIIYNTTDSDYLFESGHKIAQGIIQPIVHGEFELVSELDEGLRGDNGFGSTGK